MSSILVYGGSPPERQAKIDEMLERLSMEQSENNPDLLVVDTIEKKKSIGIGQARKAKKFLVEKPFQHKDKVVLVNRAELLTAQAQNALLKTLEEPPTYATIILNTKTEDSLLETVVSRCKKIRINSETPPKTSGPSVKKILKMSIGDKLAWAATYSKEDRVVVIETLESWIADLRKNMTPTAGQNIRTILEIKKDLENTNVSLKLALENMLIKIKTGP